MGEVYRATDTKLGRDVALKVLPAEMASSPERLERFRREAKALAALDHPGIVTIFSVEEADAVHFLTMQLVEGQPLDHLIAAGGLAAREVPRDRRRPRRRPGRRARQGDRPPRPEARQHHGERRRAGEGPRLRPRPDERAGGGGVVRLATADRSPHARGRRHGNGALHVAGAGVGPPARPPHRHLLARRRAPRDGDREPALPGVERGGSPLGDPPRPAARGDRRPAGPAARAGLADQPVPREGPEPAHAEREGDSRRACRAAAPVELRRDFPVRCAGRLDRRGRRRIESALDRRPPVRQPEPRRGQRVLQRRAHRGDHRGPLEGQGAPRHLPNVGHAVEGREEGRADDRPRPGRPLRPRGRRPKGRQQPPNHGPADRRADRCPPLVRQVQRHARRRVRGAGAGVPGDRPGARRHADLRRAPAPRGASHRERAGVRALPAGAAGSQANGRQTRSSGPRGSCRRRSPSRARRLRSWPSWPGPG